MGEYGIVAQVAGSAFGVPGHLRPSFPNDLDTCREGIRRIRQFVTG